MKSQPTTKSKKHPAKRKKRIQRYVEQQYNRTDRRYGETPLPVKPVPNIYKEPVKYCISLFRQGFTLHDAVYYTRLSFTDPKQPHYIPIERWNSETFYSALIRYLKAN